MKRRTLAVGLMCGLGLLAGCAHHPTSAEAEACNSSEACNLKDAPTKKPAASAKASAKMATFGSEAKLTDAEAVPVEKVLAAPDQYKNQYVRLSGTVTSVCAKKGCWLRVAPKGDGQKTVARDVFIKFQDPSSGRLVPMEAIGHDAAAEGVVRIGQMSEAAARHYKKDSGASDEEVAKIVGPQKQVVLVKPSVAIEGIERPAEK